MRRGFLERTLDLPRAKSVRAALVFAVTWVNFGLAGGTQAPTRSEGEGGPETSTSSHPRLHEVWREPIKTVVASRAPSRPPWPVTEYSTRKPSDKAVWIEGYWDFDAAGGRYLWVPGAWRVPPPGRSWVAGYWTQDNEGWYRVAGFWTGDRATPYRRLVPPSERPAEVRGARPSPLHLWIEGHYVPKGGEMVWTPGFWSKHQPGWTWVPAAWLERPEGWVYQEGYWLKDQDLHAARSHADTGEPVAGLVRPSPNRLGGPITDAEALLRAWASERSLSPQPSINLDDLRLQPPPGDIPGVTASGSAASRRATARGALPLWSPGQAISDESRDTSGSTGGLVGRRNEGQPISIPPNRGPSPAYYVGNDAPGTTYRSYSQTPSGWPSTSTYVGSTLPGTSYRSYSVTASGVPGTSSYVGGDLPGSSFRSYSPSSVDSIGNYGYGTTAPGSTAGQIGVTSP